MPRAPPNARALRALHRVGLDPPAPRPGLAKRSNSLAARCAVRGGARRTMRLSPRIGTPCEGGARRVCEASVGQDPPYGARLWTAAATQVLCIGWVLTHRRHVRVWPSDRGPWPRDAPSTSARRAMRLLPRIATPCEGGARRVCEASLGQDPPYGARLWTAAATQVLCIGWVLTHRRHVRVWPAFPRTRRATRGIRRSPPPAHAGRCRPAGSGEALPPAAARRAGRALPAGIRGRAGRP
jgi:hypothetical protein